MTDPIPVHTVVVNLGAKAGFEGIRIQKVDLGSLFLRVVMVGKDPAPSRRLVSDQSLPTMTSSQQPLDQTARIVRFIILDPVAMEEEIQELVEVLCLIDGKGELKPAWERVALVSVKMALSEFPKSLSQKPEVSSSRDCTQNMQEVGHKESSKQSPPLKETLQKMRSERPDLTPQISVISKWIAKLEKPLEMTSLEKKTQVSLKEVKTSLREMGSKQLIFISQSLLQDHPVLACAIMKDLCKQCNEKELVQLKESLQDHPLLAIEVAKNMKKEEGTAFLKQLVDLFVEKSPEIAFAAAKAMKGAESSKQLEKLVESLKETSPLIAVKAGKEILGDASAKVLSSLTMQLAGSYPDLALEAAKEMRGKDRLENLASLVKQLYKQHPELALKLAHLVVELARVVLDPQIRNQLLALISPPLEIREIGLAANPFAQTSAFRSSLSGASSSKAKNKKKEKEEEETQGASLLTFYIDSPFQEDFIQKIEKILLLEGMQLKIQEVKDYKKLYHQLKDEKMGSLFFQRKAFLKPPYSALVDLYIEPFGLYSEKVRSIQELTKKSSIAIPKELVSKQRAIALLDEIGLAECAYEEIEESGLINLIGKYKAVVLPSLEAWRFGLLSRALALEDKNSPYVYALATSSNDLEEEEFVFLKNCLTSQQMRFYMETEYQGVVLPAF